MNRFARQYANQVSDYWYERASSLFIAVIMASTLSIFEDFWWKETFAIAYYTLFAAALIDLLLPLRSRGGKLTLQSIAAVAITVRFARIEWAEAAPHGWREWLTWLEAHVVQLHPFIWISSALLLLHVGFTAWTITRPRMFGLIGASLLVLTIADSFTPIWLWDNVGLVVFVGLLWLVANHLSKLQREHPDSWKELFEYPVQLLTPIVIVLSVLMIIGLNMPSVAPLLQDPYTIWKNARGEQVQVFLGDKAISSSSTPSVVGNANSGYSRNDSELGGGFDYDYSPMMTVSTSNRSYWRGETKSIYTGQGWESSNVAAGQRNDIIVDSVESNVELRDGLDRSSAQTIEVHQIVTMIRPDSYPVLFGAAPVLKVNWVNNEEERFPNHLSWSPQLWELRWAENSDQKYPESYSITSAVTVIDEEALRQSQASLSDAASAARFLQLPNELPDRVTQLAEQITEEAGNDYDKARLLESYLKSNFVYNNKPDMSKLSGASKDFVDQFLFELQEGYCDYFSTSMVVMARSLGLPARWVKGFAPGVLPMDYSSFVSGYLDSEEMNPNGAGTYTVRNSDAHSWAEVYFEGHGWVPFEPTAGFSFPYTMYDGSQIAMPDYSDVEAAETPAPAVGQKTSNKQIGWAAIVVLAGALTALIIARRHTLLGMWRRYKHGSYTANDRIVLETHKLLRMCVKRGMKREEHETLREAVMRWSQSQKRLKDKFIAVLDGFEKAKYSPMAASNEDADQFVYKVRALIDELK